MLVTAYNSSLWRAFLGVPVLQDITNTPLDAHEESQTQQMSDLKCKIEEALGAISKLPSDEALERVRNLKVQYLATNGDPCHQWHTLDVNQSLGLLNYPALACMLNGGYYVDYAGILGTMELPVMHHKTWDGLVSLVGSHVEKLAKWSCEMVRDNIIKRGDQGSGWVAMMDFI